MNTDDHDERGEPMDEASCLYTFSLLMDGRPVEAGLERAARAYAASHPHCERVLADWQLQTQALAGLPGRTARPDFTERVLAAAERAGSLASIARTSGEQTGLVNAGSNAGADRGRSRSRGREPREVETLRPFARQLALAASVALLLSLVFVLARPADLRADAGIARHRHAADGFRASPFAPDDIESGLRARLADAEFGARLGRSRP